MSDATDKLAQSRLAIVEYLQRRERRHDGRVEERDGPADEAAEDGGDEPRDRGWFSTLKHGLKTWWRYHPAHMALEVATPVLQTYAREKPVQVLGVAAAAGAALVLLRPWRLISVTTLLVALVKSSQLSSVVLSAMSAAGGWQEEAGRER
ncbi:MAG: hypothetical protein HYX47_20735 [Burkholderiales bacterium]|nr:hypothetical protein [Burkholderiales bacterium]